MGTDIHTYAEYQTPSGAWTLDTEPNPYHADYPDEEPPTRPVPGYNDRNYGLFAILADVRNGSGFAGVKTGEPTTPIDHPRSVPVDASPVYAAEVEQWDGAAHSHSWFTLAELQAHTWDESQAVNSFLMHPEDGYTRSRPKLPADFDFDAWAIEAELILNAQGEDALRERYPNLGICGGISGGNEHQWRRVSWRVSHREQAGPEWFAYLDELVKLAEHKGLSPYQVRVVFFFDS